MIAFVVRGSILVSLGAGILVVPQIWWLFVAGLLVTAIINWPARRRRVIVLRGDLGDSTEHYHYCPNCDRQWHHGVSRCVEHWAVACPACTATGARPAVRSA
jgi:hypothetical protein